MANKLFDQVGGIITVRLKGKDQEKVINMAMIRGIYIWDIKKTGDSMSLKVRNSGYKALQNIAEENGYIIEITDKQGFPVFKHVLKRRMGFIGGSLVFVIALYFMSSFIWFIEVSGNEKIDAPRIMLSAARHGIYKGAAKWNFSRSSVEEAMLRDMSQLSYVRVDITGVKARIEVVEKIFPKEEITGPCHIVAAKEGIIDQILVFEGQANVKEGDVVARGDILISGVVFPEKSPYIFEETEEEPEPYTVRARGEVKASVCYEGYGECPLRSEKMILSGRELKKVYLETPWRNLVLKGRRENSFPFSREETSRRILKTPLGEFGFYKICIQEEIKDEITYSEKEAIKIARDKAMKTLARKMDKSVKVCNSKIDILSSPSDPILRIKVSVETIENIDMAEPINAGKNSN